MTNATSSDLANFVSSGAKQHGYATTKTNPTLEGCSLKLLSPDEHKQVLRKTSLAEAVQLTRPNLAELHSSARSRSKLPPPQPLPCGALSGAAS